MLLAYPDLVNVKTANQQWTPLKFAIRQGQLDIIKLLIEHGADIKQAGLLNTAVYTTYQQFEVVKYLLEQGVNPNNQGLFNTLIQETLESKLKCDMLRGDLLRLMLSYGYIYEYRFEYIDKETKQQVNKI